MMMSSDSNHELLNDAFHFILLCIFQQGTDHMEFSCWNVLPGIGGIGTKTT